MRHLLALLCLLLAAKESIAADCASKIPAQDAKGSDLREALACLDSENASLRAELAHMIVSAIPSGAVLAFKALTCPEGWSVYTKASGKFIVGVGMGLDQREFATQEVGGNAEVKLTVPQLPTHQHDTLIAVQVGYATWGTGPVRTAVVGRTEGQFITGLTSPVGEGLPVPILPPYVALLYCEKS